MREETGLSIIVPPQYPITGMASSSSVMIPDLESEGAPLVYSDRIVFIDCEDEDIEGLNREQHGKMAGENSYISALNDGGKSLRPLRKTLAVMAILSLLGTLSTNRNFEMNTFVNHL